MSKAWRSILYAMGALSALCIFAAVMIAVVPQSDDRFLIFSTNKIELAINGEVELSSIRLQTNLPQNSIEFKSEDESVFKISERKIKPLKIGSGLLAARAEISGKTYRNSVLVEVTSLPVVEGDTDFDVQLYYNGSAYSLASFSQEINLFIAGGNFYERAQAEATGYPGSFYFVMPSGYQVRADGECVNVLGSSVSAASEGSCIVRVENTEEGKYKAVTVNVSAVPLSDVSLSCGSSVSLAVGDYFAPAVSFVPAFVSDACRSYLFEIKNVEIIRFNTDRFVAESVGQTQITFVFGQIKKTVQVVVTPAFQELRAEFLGVDFQLRVAVRLNLFCLGDKSAIENGALGAKLVLEAAEYNLPENIILSKDTGASLGYDYVYKLSGQLPDEFDIKFYLLHSPSVYVIVHIVLNQN